VHHKNRAVTIEARPESIRVDIDKCALLVIDMQNDFGAKGGMFNRAGIDISPIERAVPRTMRALAAARLAAIPIVYLKMQHTADLANAGRPNAPHWIKHRPLGVGETAESPDGRPSRVLVEDTWNTEILPSLAPQEGDVILPKHRYSGFFETDLDRILRDRGIEYLVVTGCTTSVCVESTIRDAMFRDYHCLLLEDCTGEPIASDQKRGNHEASLLTIQLLFGWISNSEHFVEALARSHLPGRELTEHDQRQPPSG
jgi:ureidoacrylate peracid hydrolase